MHSRLRLKRVGAAGIGVGVLCASVLGVVPAASASVAPAGVGAHSTTAVVVKIAKARGGFKNVMTNTIGVGATLYTASSCTGACLSSWPPLFMPKGKTIPKGPKGLAGLGTVKVGKHLQVTYKKHRLYSFTGDSGASVNGNGIAGFTVIKNA